MDMGNELRVIEVEIDVPERVPLLPALTPEEIELDRVSEEVTADD